MIGGSLSPLPAWAVEEGEIAAAFVYNFVQFAAWPAGQSDDSRVVICGDSRLPLFGQLKRLAGRAAAGRQIVVESMDARPAGRCHVLVAIGLSSDDWLRARTEVGQAPVLTVGTRDTQHRDGMIVTLYVEGGRMSFDVDNTRAAAKGIQLSSRLLRLARSVQ